MRQVTKLVLEKKEVDALIKGKLLTLTLPSGETVQFESERMRNGADRPVKRGVPVKQVIKEYFLAHPKDWVKAKEVKDHVGAWGAVSQLMKKLANDGFLLQKKAGTLPTGKLRYQYRLTAKGAKNG